MAFMEIIDPKGILFLMLLSIPSQATNLDCYGKAFHCVNSTHFVICVDLGTGISTTIDDVIIPCPPLTVCRQTNRFECEFPAFSELPPESSTAANTQTTESEVTKFIPSVTTTIPFEEYFNTLSTNTLFQKELHSFTTDSSLITESITVGIDIRNVSAPEIVVTNSISKDAYSKPEPFSVSPFFGVKPSGANGSNAENNYTPNLSVISNNTISINNLHQLKTTTDIQTKVTDSPESNTKNNNVGNVTSIDITSIGTEQTITTEKVFTKDFREASVKVAATDFTSAINNQTVITKKKLTKSEFLRPFVNATSSFITIDLTEKTLTANQLTKASTKVTVNDTVDATTNQTTEVLKNRFLQPAINATSTVNASVVTEKITSTDEVFTKDFQETSQNTIATNVTNNQTTSTEEFVSNNFIQLSIHATPIFNTSAVTEKTLYTKDILVPSENPPDPENYSVGSDVTRVKPIQALNDIINASVLVKNIKNEPIIKTNIKFETPTSTVLTNNDQLNTRATESLIFNTDDNNFMHLISTDIVTTEIITAGVLNNTYYYEPSKTKTTPEPVTDTPLRDDKNIVFVSKPETNIIPNTTPSLSDSSLTTAYANIYTSNRVYANDTNVENIPDDAISPDQAKTATRSENKKKISYVNIIVEEPVTEFSLSITGNKNLGKVALTDSGSTTTANITGESLDTNILIPLNNSVLNKLETLTNSSSTTSTLDLITANIINNLQKDYQNIRNDLNGHLENVTDRLVTNKIVLTTNYEVDKTLTKGYNLDTSSKIETTTPSFSGLVQVNEFLTNTTELSMFEQTTTKGVAIIDKKVPEPNTDALRKIFSKSENVAPNEPVSTLATSQPLTSIAINSTEILSTTDIMNQKNDNISSASKEYGIFDDSKDVQTVPGTNMPSTIVSSTTDRLYTLKEHKDKAIASHRNKSTVTLVEIATSNAPTLTVDANKISLSEKIQSLSQTDIIPMDTSTALPSTKIKGSEAFHSQPEYILTEKTDSFPQTTTNNQNNKKSKQTVSLEKTKSSNNSEINYLPASSNDRIVPDRDTQDMILFTSMSTAATIKEANVTSTDLLMKNINEEKLGALKDTSYMTEKNIVINTDTATYTVEAAELASQGNELNYWILENIGESSTARRFLSESTTEMSPISNMNPVMTTENPSTLFIVTYEGQSKISAANTERYNNDIPQSSINAQPSDDFNKNNLSTPHSDITLSTEVVVENVRNSSTTSPNLGPTVPGTNFTTTESSKHSDVPTLFLDSLSFPYPKVLINTEIPVRRSTSSSVVNTSTNNVSVSESKVSVFEKESNPLQNIVLNSMTKLEAKDQDSVPATAYTDLNMQSHIFSHNNVRVTTASNITVTKPVNTTLVEKENNTNFDLQSQLLRKGHFKTVSSKTNSLQIDLTTQSSISVAGNVRETAFFSNGITITTPFHSLFKDNKSSKMPNPELQSVTSDLNMESNTLSEATITTNKEDTTSKIDLLGESRGPTLILPPSSNSIESVIYSMQTTTPLAKPDQNGNNLSVFANPNSASQLVTKRIQSESPQMIAGTAQTSDKSLHYDILGKPTGPTSISPPSSNSIESVKYSMQTTTPLVKSDQNGNNISVSTKPDSVSQLMTKSKQRESREIIAGTTRTSEKSLQYDTQGTDISSNTRLLRDAAIKSSDVKSSSPSTIGLQSGTWKMEAKTDANINKPDTSNTYSKIAVSSTFTVQSIRNIQSIEDYVKQASSQTTLSTSSPDLHVATEVITESGVLVENNLASEKTHSGIISILMSPLTHTKEKKQKSDNKDEMEERQEYLVQTYKDPVTLSAKDSSKPSSDILLKSLTNSINDKMQKDIAKKEEMPIRTENNNLKLTSSVEVTVKKINTDESIDFSTHTVGSENKKRTPTHDLIENSTASSNQSHTLNSKPKDQNNASLHVHNTTVISNDQSSTTRYMSQTNTTAASDGQTAFESTTRENKSNKFSCTQKKRGRYADELDCRKFYICLGNSHVVEGRCPVNTVFSEFRKQCTKNLSQCIRNNQFRCVAEGHFSDFLNENVYYICVKNNIGAFTRFKMLCQNGYHLNKTSVRCVLNKELQQSTSKSDRSKNNSDQTGSLTKQEQEEKSGTPEKKSDRSKNYSDQSGYLTKQEQEEKSETPEKKSDRSKNYSDQSGSLTQQEPEEKSEKTVKKIDRSKINSDQSGSLTKQEPEEKSERPEKKFKCIKEGIFADPSDCKRYFECTKIDTIVYRQKRKKCDSGEIFHRDKKKCVDSDSYETEEC